MCIRDSFQATRGGGHGDYHMIVLAPASVQEMASLTVKGFNLADKYSMIAMILADGTIGQMMEPISFEDVEVELSLIHISGGQLLQSPGHQEG